MLHSHCRVYLKEVMEAETHPSREGGLESESQRPARDGRRQMRERKGERWEKKEGKRSRGRNRKTAGEGWASGGLVTEEGWSREEAGERAQREGLAALGAPGQRGLTGWGGLDCQGSFHHGSDTRRSLAPGPPISFSPAHHQLSQAGR